MPNKNINYVIDTHVHIGKEHKYSQYLNEIKDSAIPITGAIVFPNSKDLRNVGEEQANNNVLSGAQQRNKNSKEIMFYPYKLVGPGLNREKLDQYFGAKWHRHSTDPGYNIDYGHAKPSSTFNKFMEYLRENKMPIVFEDFFDNLQTFMGLVDRDKILGRLDVIIPHMGFGTKGYESYKKIMDSGIFGQDNVWTDTSSTKSLEAIKDYIKRYGCERLMFGSDFGAPNNLYPGDSFGNPKRKWNPKEELEKILSLGLKDNQIKAITHGNILKLLCKTVSNKSKKPAN